ILGTSIGAFNGSVIAAEPGPVGVQRLAGLWDELTGADLFQASVLSRIRNVATLQPAIHRSAELHLVLEHVHGADKNIEDLQIPFQCVASSIERAAEHWFVKGPLIPALLASSAVPVLFPPIEIEQEHFYDGGLVNSVPLGRAVELGASVIYVLQVGRLEAPLRPPERLHEAALISFEIARRHRYATALETLPTNIDVHVLPSGNPVEFDDRRQLRWRDTGDTLELVDGAYTASSAYLRENELW
ncbi:MAG: patatin-like phospholipase family protein, partial [Acidimicrobiia bacterium]